VSKKLLDDGYSPTYWPGFGEKWEGGIVPFEADCELENNELALFSQAMKHIEDKTNIRFVRYNSNAHKNYIILTDLEDGSANSWVGRMTVPGWQRVNLDSMWMNLGHDFGSAVHELMHALGWPHTQSRPDRDSYVTINDQNIIEDNKHNFDINESSDVYEKVQKCRPYNYGSIMHYDDEAFSKNGEKTITTKNSNKQSEIGQRDGLNTQDAEEINEYYFGNPKCTTTGSSLTSYTFYQGKDSAGYDIEYYSFPGITVENMKARCDSLPDCKGFNTNGWIKFYVKDQSQWDHWTNDASKGFYMKSILS
jgi:hypothetical protein